MKAIASSQDPQWPLAMQTLCHTRQQTLKPDLAGYNAAIDAPRSWKSLQNPRKSIEIQWKSNGNPLKSHGLWPPHGCEACEKGRRWLACGRLLAALPRDRCRADEISPRAQRFPSIFEVFDAFQRSRGLRELLLDVRQLVPGAANTSKAARRSLFDSLLSSG